MRRTLILPALLAVTVALMPMSISSASARSRGQTTTCGLDRAWLTDTVEGSLYELTGAKIARERSATPAVRQIAATINRDHAPR